MNIEKLLPKFDAIIPKVESTPVYFNGNPDSVQAGALATRNRLQIYNPQQSYIQGQHIGTIAGVVVGLLALTALSKGL